MGYEGVSFLANRQSVPSRQADRAQCSQSSLLAREQGSALIAALLVALAVGAWMAVIMQSSFTEYKMSLRHLAMQRAFNLAESGIEEGIRTFNASDWGGWTEYASGYFRTIDAPDTSSDFDATISIFVSKDARSPQIVAEGSLVGPDGNSVSRQIKVETSTGGSFANGLLARRQIIMNGNDVLVDSYDSSIGDYTPTSNVNRFSNGNVAVSQPSGGGPLFNNAQIYGRVAVPGEFNADQSFHMRGTLGVWGAELGSKDLDRVVEGFGAEIPDVSVPDFAAWKDVSEVNGGSSDINTGILTLGNPTDSSPQQWQAERLTLSNLGSELVIDGPVCLYVRRNIQVSGSAAIRVTSRGSLELYSPETIAISGNGPSFGMQNETRKAKNFSIYNTTPYEGGSSVVLSGIGKVYTVVYAPKSIVQLQGPGESGTVHGAVVGLDVTLNSGYRFHYDEALSSHATASGGGGSLLVDLWRELRGVGERLPFDQPESLASRF